MLLPIEIQFNMVLFSIFAGILTGILFDFYRIVRGIGVKKIIIIIEDILFWILCGLIIFIFLLKTDYAFLTIYVYIFIGIGIIIHLKTLSPKLIKIENKLACSTLKFIRIMIKGLRYTLKSIFSK